MYFICPVCKKASWIPCEKGSIVKYENGKVILVGIMKNINTLELPLDKILWDCRCFFK